MPRTTHPARPTTKALREFLAQATGADPSRASYGGLRAVLYNVTPLAVHHGKSRKI